MRFNYLLKSFLTAALLSSCTSGKLLVSGVGYQSLRTEFAQPEKIPSTAKIAVEYFFNQDGEVQPIVYNLTSEILTLDQTKSFIIMPDGRSVSYYDPNVYTQTEGSFHSTTTGSSFNLGSIAGAVGVGGPVGQILDGINVGKSSTDGIIRQNTVSRTDQPTVNIGPNGSIAMSKAYKIDGIGQYMRLVSQVLDVKRDQSPLKFSICVTYSFDDGKTYYKLVTNFYVGTNLYETVSNKKVSDAFNKIYAKKPDALVEPLYIFSLTNNISKQTYDIMGDFLTHSNVYDYYIQGSLIDYN